MNNEGGEVGPIISRAQERVTKSGNYHRLYQKKLRLPHCLPETAANLRQTTQSAA